MNHHRLENKQQPYGNKPTGTSKQNLQSRLCELRFHEVSGDYAIRLPHNAHCSSEFLKSRREFSKQCYKMVNEFNLDPEIVEVTIWILDKLAMELDTSLLLEEAQQQRYWAKGMAAFAISVKAFDGQQKLQTPQFPQHWSRYFSSLEDLEQSELSLLLLFDFDISPPTASAFARTLLSLLPPAMIQLSTTENEGPDENSIFDQSMELVRLQIRLSLTDPSFARGIHSPSTMAQAALHNAIQNLLPHNRCLYIQQFFANALGRPFREEAIHDVEQVLSSLQTQLYERLLHHIVAEQEVKMMMEEEEEEENDNKLLSEPDLVSNVPSFILLQRNVSYDRQFSLLTIGSSSRSLLSAS